MECRSGHHFRPMLTVFNSFFFLKFRCCLHLWFLNISGFLLLFVIFCGLLYTWTLRNGDDVSTCSMVEFC